MDDAYIQVKKISRHGSSVLVEWLEHNLVQRGYLPASVIDEEGYVNEEDLLAAIPYGIPWGDIIAMSATPEALEARLYQIGIWTYEDLLARPQEVVGALQATYMVDFGALKRAAERFREEK